MMADIEKNEVVPKLPPIDPPDHQIDPDTLNHITLEEDSFTRPGAQLADKQTFRNKIGETITGYPLIVDFRRLLQLTPDSSRTRLQEFGIIPGISNRDLLHAVVGLYDVSLSEMTPDVIYSTVCEKWARTVILVRDLKETLLDLETRRKKEPEVKEEEDEDDEASTSVKSDTACSKGSELSADEDVYECEEEQPSKFCDVYSDTESEEEEEEEDDEEDFSKGINSFIQSVIDRRKARKSHEGPLTEDMVGIENRIIGCATFEKKYVKHKDRVIHLTLVSVRRRCRKYGLGKYMLSQIVDPKVVGHYDAVVVHADNEAVDFFQKFGFSDDVVLNSRWKDLAEQFTNCTLMTYLPGFTGHRLLSTLKIPGYEVFELEQEFNKWKEKTVEVYQQQITCMMRFKHEILQLKFTTAKQNQLLETLLEENEKLKTDKLVAEKEFLDYRLLSAKSTFQHDEAEEDISTQELIDKLQQQVDKMDIRLQHKRSSSRDLEKLLETPKNNGSCTVVDESRYMAFPQSEKKTEEPYDHIKDSAFFYDVTEQFKQQMRLDLSCFVKCEVSTISKALLPEKVKKAHREKIRTLKDPTMVIDMYFCGTLERPHRIKEILKSGFAEEDFSYGDYGKGLYFSKFPSKAAQFSAHISWAIKCNSRRWLGEVRVSCIFWHQGVLNWLKVGQGLLCLQQSGSLLKAEVGIGHVETVIKPDRTRTAPSVGYDSIIVPGRLSHKLGQGDAAMNQEYVVFDVNQILPLCVLYYETS